VLELEGWRHMFLESSSTEISLRLRERPATRPPLRRGPPGGFSPTCRVLSVLLVVVV
jgi:hypothetical protein